MTLRPDNSVRLSSRDWVGIIGVSVTVLIAVLSAFVHHDRTLMQLVTQQQAMEQRLSKIEIQLEKMRP